MMNILEQKLIELRTELNSFKTSQGLGGSNYRVLKNQSTLDIGSGGEWWVGFQANSNFPLVNWGFEVWENGILRENPSNAFFWTTDKGDSIGNYSFSLNWGVMKGTYWQNLPTIFDAYSPNISIGYLIANDSSNGSIVIKTKSNCEGVILIEKVR